MKAHELIKQARLAKGLTEGHAAELVGLSVGSYFHLEMDEQEVYEVFDLGDLKSVCRVLELDFFELLGLKQPVDDLPERSWSRALMIINARKALGWSQDELADKVGFYTEAVIQMESDDNFLETWSFNLVTTLAGLLGLKAEDLARGSSRS